MRLFKSPEGGKLMVYLDGEAVRTFSTRNESAAFYWEPVFSGTLQDGKHNLSIEQLGGYNVLNIAYVKSSGSVPPADFSNKTIIYRLVGTNDFQGEKTKVVQNDSSSTFYYLRSGLPVTAYIDVPYPGVYNVTYAISGNAEVLVDGSEATGTVLLPEGRHIVEVRPLNSSTVYVDHVTLTKKGVQKMHSAEIVNYTRRDPSSYSVWVNSTGPFFLQFTRGYDKDWVATVNGRRYLPSGSYLAVNAYYIEESGLNRIDIEYEPQKSLYAGLIIGSAGLLACIIYTAGLRE
jgi:hypothetical protein